MLSTVHPASKSTHIDFINTDLPPLEHHDSHRILEAAAAILEQGLLLLRSLPNKSYGTKIPIVFNGSIGAHYRHCLDHFVSITGALDSGLIDYDARARDRRLETDVAHAIHQTESLLDQFQTIASISLLTPVKACCEVSYTHGDSPRTHSTFGREFSYAIAHAIHHYALIAVMARLLNLQLPSTFGVAPSTVAHQHQTFSS